MAGGVDTHVHVGPFINEETMVWDVFELAREAAAAGLRAAVYKSPFGSSCVAASLANKYAGGATVVAVDVVDEKLELAKNWVRTTW